VTLSLVVINGKHAGRSIRAKGSKLAIGRAPDCHLRPDSDRISRHHCVLLIEEGRVVVRDLGSRNGTFVNGEKIEGDRALENADRLTVGRLELEVRMTADDAATAGSRRKPAGGSRTSAKSSTRLRETKKSEAAASTVDAADDELDLTDKPAERRTSSQSTADKPTQTLRPAKGQPASAHPAPAETAEKPKTKEEDHRSDHIVSEEEKEKARNTRAIVGVSKAAQAKRVTGTSSGAAAEALRRFRR
jgi:pSer/pThr/pTyr-binding forkhead associated (FHA) protein